MALAENLAAFLPDFGVTATVGGASVRGIFDHAYQDALGIAGHAPVLQCATASVSSADYGTAVVINATSYTVAERHDDGTGWTRLQLEVA